MVVAFVPIRLILTYQNNTYSFAGYIFLLRIFARTDSRFNAFFFKSEEKENYKWKEKKWKDKKEKNEETQKESWRSDVEGRPRKYWAIK